VDFEYTQEQRLLIDTAADVADEFGPDFWYEKEEAGEYAPAFWDALAEAGLQGALVPEEYGGAGMGMTEMALAMETLVAEGTGLAGVWYLVLTGTMATTALRAYGTDAQKERYLPGVASGDVAFCHGITEPDAGTNTLRAETFADREGEVLEAGAERDGDAFVVNGEKTYITWSDHADAMLLVTRTAGYDPDDPTHGMTILLVDMPDPAVEVEPIDLHGIGYSNSCTMYIDDLEVPAENVLGEVHEGWPVLLEALNPERLAFAAAATGLGRLAIDHAADYAREREVFGQPVGAHQGVQHPLARSYARVEAARQMWHKAAWTYDRHGGGEAGLESNVAKAVAVEAGHDAVHDAMQAFGGGGYAKENHVERWWREVNLTRLAPVTQQMAYNYIGERGLDLPRSY